MNAFSRWITLGAAFVAGILVTVVVVRVMPKSRIDGESVASATATPKVLYWYDPMYPDKHFDQPGKSPFMDMQLVPKHADAGATSEGTVRIDPRLAQNLGVRTGVARLGQLDEPVRATVTLAFDESASSVLQARVAGVVERLLVRTPLTVVKRGEPMLVLIAPEWTAAQEEYLALRRSTVPALAEVRDAARQRLNLLGMDESQIRAIERSGKAQTRITVHASRDGVVTELLVRDGESVMPGTPLARLNGIDAVWAHAAIAEAQIAQVRNGASAELTLSAFPGMTFAGTVAAILPSLDPVARTQTARIVLANPEHRLAAGMIGEARIVTGDAVETVLIPSEAVIATGTRQVVIVEEGEGIYRAQEVRVGAEAVGNSAILAGIDDGERVVLSGQFLIDSEASLTGTLARLGSDATSTPAPKTARSPPLHATFGTLLAISDGDWDVDTGPVPSMDMGAMRMTFRPPPSETKFKIGDTFDFAFFRNDEGDFEIDAASIKMRTESSR